MTSFNNLSPNQSVSEIEELVKSVFLCSQGKATKVVYSIYSILKQSEQFIQILIKRIQSFDFLNMFGFLKYQNIDEGKFVLFEQIMFKLFKRDPQKIANLIEFDKEINQLLWKHVYERSIYRIIYTAVFCFWGKSSISEKIQPLSKQKQILITAEMVKILELPNLAQFILQIEKQPSIYTDQFLQRILQSSKLLQSLLNEFLMIFQSMTYKNCLTIFNHINIKVLMKNFYNLRKLNKDIYQEYCEGIIGILINMIKLFWEIQLRLDYERQLDQNYQTTKYFDEYLQENKEHDKTYPKLSKHYIVFQKILDLLPDLQHYLLSFQIQLEIQISSGQNINSTGLLNFKIIQFFVVIIEKTIKIEGAYLKPFGISPKKTKTGLNAIDICDKLNNQQLLIIPDIDPFLIIKKYLLINRWNNILQNQLVKMMEYSLKGFNYYRFFEIKYLQVCPSKHKLFNGSNQKKSNLSSVEKIQLKALDNLKFKQQQTQSTQQLIEQMQIIHANSFSSQFKQKVIYTETFLGTLISEFKNRNFIFLTTTNKTCSGNIFTIYKMTKILQWLCFKDDWKLLIQKFSPHWQKFINEDIKKYQIKIQTINPLFKDEQFLLTQQFLNKLKSTQNQILQSIREVVQYDHSRNSNRNFMQVLINNIQLQTKAPWRKKSNQLKQEMTEEKTIIYNTNNKRRRKQSLIDINFISKIEGLTDFY